MKPENLKISTEAQHYLSEETGVIVPPDLGDAEALSRFREHMGSDALAQLARIDGKFNFVDDSVADVPVLRISGAAKPDADRVLIHLHGGGYITGSTRGNASIPTQIAIASGMDVVSVEYRLAPEHPFPAALDDVMAVCERLLVDHSPAHVGLFGESAGGGLAAATALRLRDDGKPLPAALALIAPFADLTGSGASMTFNDGVDPDLDWNSLAPGAAAYAADREPTHPYLSPVFADYSGLPPMLVQAGGLEVLLDDAIRIGHGAEEAGVDVTLDVRDGLWHCWHFDPALPESQRACASIAGFFHEHLY